MGMREEEQKGAQESWDGETRLPGSKGTGVGPLMGSSRQDTGRENHQGKAHM